MSYSPVRIYGDALFRLVPDRPVKRAREVHGLTQRWQTPSKDYFALGDAPDGWPNMRIIGIETETEIDDIAYDTRLECQGILGSETYIELDRRETETEEGWDMMNLSIFTREPNAARWAKGVQYLNDAGSVISGYGTMWATDRMSSPHAAKDYQIIDLQFKGLRQSSKGVKRRINTTAQALSTTGFGAAIIIDPVYTGPINAPTSSSTTTSVLGGNVEFDLPQISVTDTMISTSAPPTQLVPGNWIPPNAPSITVVSITGGNDIYHYPSGWKVLNLVSEQIPGQSLWLISLTWGYQRGNTPQA